MICSNLRIIYGSIEQHRSSHRLVVPAYSSFTSFSIFSSSALSTFICAFIAVTLCFPQLSETIRLTSALTARVLTQLLKTLPSVENLFTYLFWQTNLPQSFLWNRCCYLLLPLLLILSCATWRQLDETASKGKGRADGSLWATLLYPKLFQFELI